MRTQPWRPPLPDGPPPTVVITQRQAQMLDGLFHGRTADQIGRALRISPYTVAAHIRRLRQRIGADTTEQLVALAVSGYVRVEVLVDRYQAGTKAAL